MNKQTATEIFERLQTANPEPTTELIYHNDFELLVAVVLSAQATDIRVNIVTEKLFAQANNPRDMVTLGEDQVRTLIQSLGLYKNKAKNVILLSQQLIDRHAGQVPQHMEELIELAGVGRKTANVILNTLYHHPTIAVDTHVFRVSKRLKLAPKSATTPEAVEKHLMKKIPKAFLLHAHHWLILHGRYTCLARKPLCQGCIIKDLCPYPSKTPVD